MHLGGANPDNPSPRPPTHPHPLSINKLVKDKSVLSHPGATGCAQAGDQSLHPITDVPCPELMDCSIDIYPLTHATSVVLLCFNSITHVMQGGSQL